MKTLNHVLLPLALMMTGAAMNANAQPLDASALQQETQAVSNYVGKLFAKSASTSSSTISTHFMLKRVGNAKNAVIQGIAVDSKNRYLYTLNASNGTHEGVTNRYAYDEQFNKVALDAQQPSGYIGHQGITVEPQSSKLWASAGPTVKNKGWYAVRFTYQPTSQPTTVQVIQLFGKGYSKGTNSMPTFSPDGKYLVVRSAIKKNGQNTNIIRVYDTSKLDLKNTTDISHQYLYEWPVSSDLTPAQFPFQGLATDGKYVYMISGSSNSASKKLQVYSLQGKLLQNMQNVSLGKNEAFTDGKDKHWEPEGMAITLSPSKSLLVGFATGDHGKRNARIYSIPIGD